ncbi:MAG: cobalt-precorrin 5A hydrolase [Clostridia bacterium]|nr:cobalt-precorrin 5A hydrolase [Clostridia bacterium]
MNYCLFCFSDSGAELAKKLCGLLKIDIKCVHTTEKFAAKYGFTSHKKVADAVGELFAHNDALIFVGACGIAVREIAPHIKSKTTDPAVVVIDDKGRFAIPILSGHIGGANELAKRIAELIGAQAVITASTDGAGKFSCDAWAAKNGFAISSMKAAKEISAAILVRDIPVCSEYDLPDVLPNGLYRGGEGELGIYIGVRKKEPFETTLRLIPRSLCLGIGCRRGTGKETIENAVNAVFDKYGLDIRAVGGIASIDLKKDEAGLLGFAAELGIEPAFYTAKELDSVTGDFEESEFVRKTVGTGNVCERAAALGGGKITVKKTAENGVTAAVAEKNVRIVF